MTKNRTEYLALLGTGGDECADLVSTLHEAAAILDGTSPFLGSDGFDEASKLRVGLRLAMKLRDVSQRLCDHCRVSGDGRCRYCQTLMGVDPA